MEAVTPIPNSIHHRIDMASISSPVSRHTTGGSVLDTITIAYDTINDVLQQAIQEQSDIGWEKLLSGMGTVTWKTLPDMIDAGNPAPPKRSASDWINSATHQLLKFSLRCWKARNQAIHGPTRQEQQQIALQRVRDQITNIYRNPPELAPQFRSIFEVPIEHRLKMSLNAAEQWASLITP